MSIVGVERSDGEFYTNTTVVIPLRLKKMAKARGLSISRICTEGLLKALNEDSKKSSEGSK